MGCTVNLAVVAVASPLLCWVAWTVGKCILVEVVGWAFEQLCGTPEQYLHRGYIDNLKTIVDNRVNHAIGWHKVDTFHPEFNPPKEKK